MTLTPLADDLRAALDRSELPAPELQYALLEKVEEAERELGTERVAELLLSIADTFEEVLK